MILLIVDNSVFRENLKEAFELSNYQVCDLEKLSDLELLSDIKPDLVVYCNTKDINGRRFCNWVIGNKMFNNLPIILLTHDKIEQKNEKDQTYVGCNCIQLPFDPNNLLELVEGLLKEMETWPEIGNLLSIIQGLLWLNPGFLLTVSVHFGSLVN